MSTDKKSKRADLIIDDKALLKSKVIIKNI